MTQKILMTVAVASFASTLGLSAQDGAAYRKNYSDYLSEWEADLDRRSGISTPVAETKATRERRPSSPWTPPERIRQERIATGKGDSSLSIEAFYAMATEKLFSEELVNDGDDWEIDLSGISLQYSFWESVPEGINDGSLSSPKAELFVSAALAYGDENPGKTWDIKDEYQVWLGQVSVGGNLIWKINPTWEAFVGARLGLSYISVKNEWDDGYEVGSESESGVGIIYGVRLGTNVYLAENHALTFAADYWGTTARAEFSDEYYSEKTQEQSYCVFSVGYKYSF